MPARARDLPAPVWAAVDAADVVVHAGDWVTVELLDALEARADRLVGVWGNNDGPPLRARLPEVARVSWTACGSRSCTRPARRRAANAAAPPPTRTSTCSCSGTATSRGTPPRHSGLRLLNPGSPTDRRRQPTHTWMTAEVVDGELVGPTLHHLER